MTALSLHVEDEIMQRVLVVRGLWQRERTVSRITEIHYSAVFRKDNHTRHPPETSRPVRGPYERSRSPIYIVMLCIAIDADICPNTGMMILQLAKEEVNINFCKKSRDNKSSLVQGISKMETWPSLRNAAC